MLRFGRIRIGYGACAVRYSRVSHWPYSCPVRLSFGPPVSVSETVSISSYPEPGPVVYLASMIHAFMIVLRFT